MEKNLFRIQTRYIISNYVILSNIRLVSLNVVIPKNIFGNIFV